MVLASAATRIQRTTESASDRSKGGSMSTACVAARDEGDHAREAQVAAAGVGVGAVLVSLQFPLDPSLTVRTNEGSRKGHVQDSRCHGPFQ